MQLKVLGELTSIFNELNQAGDILSIDQSSFNVLEKTFKGMSEAEFAAKMAASGLSTELQQQIADIAGVQLSTTTLSAAQQQAAGSTGTLALAFNGLAASLGISTTALAAFLGIAVAFGAGFLIYPSGSRGHLQKNRKKIGIPDFYF
ncbi:hypothetical protein [Frisingicoccus sp.]|uniref:hypothetical protein n=1 Tax=Frisingicoccus sp. TaxID=1918627 RepID=UPI003AB3234B